MADGSSIEWTQATWNPIAGCSLVSPGCTNCYAMRVAARLERMGQPLYAGLTNPTRAGAVWTGRIRVANESVLELPLRWRKPRRIFVNSMSDLFYEEIPTGEIARIFGIMACAQQHEFQVLTKRPEWMIDRLTLTSFWEDVWENAVDYADFDSAPSVYAETENKQLSNVWLGTSIEDQPRVRERLPYLRETPAMVRFLSCEPLLGPLEIDLAGIDWVICGGESGPGARDMNPDWARALRDQCAAAGVPFFMKQMARRAPIPEDLMVREFPK